ncbi:hypothetical protein [Clostridiisalibacter paucivorans]|uniref:hypothetical protein n=1 Tax=Clostridiisalibacter paucivorans TaxID=408753 RepID=UPI00146F98CD|nr:hypothetical protein [Clostridiisalibacter paucivorans]
MRNRFMSGMLTGSILGVTASMFAANKMTPRQRRKMMKRSKNLLFNAIDFMNFM